MLASARPATANRPPPSAPLAKPTTSSTRPARMHSSTSGKGAHGGWGASSRRARRPREGGGVRGGAGGGSRRAAGRGGGRAPRAPRRAARGGGEQNACGNAAPAGCQVANGQQEESLTCHH